MKDEYLMAVDTIDGNDIQTLIEWLQTEPRLTHGERVEEFQRSWAQWEGMDHAIFCNSGSSANLLMYATLLASEDLSNRKVIVPAISWATTVAPAIQLGFEPIMCDAEGDTFGLDPNKLEDLLKEHNPGSVILVHVLGVPCNMEAILSLQDKYGFKLMEDACAATGSLYDGQKVGTFGDLSSFSYFFGHHVSTIEGGMVCTNNKRYDELLRMLRSHGWAKDLDAEAESQQAGQFEVDGFNRPFTFYYPGFNLRSSDLNAVVGLAQMKKIDRVCAGRVANHKVYQELLTLDKGFTLQHNDRAEICSIACVALAESTEHRERVTAALKSHKVETRPLGGGNMSRQPFWRSRYPEQDFPVADRIAASAFQLPTHPAHSPDDIRDICGIILNT
ncbi:MAG: aminotransferase DegT [Candidatus Hydrogenedentota bacterium]|nr:MAG: aminotransferase DegT [Candidatus Hydrogenedentota bacterium]